MRFAINTQSPVIQINDNETKFIYDHYYEIF